MSEPRYQIVPGAFEACHGAAPDKGVSCFFWLNGDRYIRSPLVYSAKLDDSIYKRSPKLSTRQEPMNDVERQAKRKSIDYAYRRGMQHASFEPSLAYPVGSVSPVLEPVKPVPAPMDNNITHGDIVTWPTRRVGTGDPAKQYLVIGGPLGRAVTKNYGPTPNGVRITDGRETWVVVKPEKELVKVGRLA